MAEQFRGAKIRANIVEKLKKRRKLLKESNSGFDTETLPLPTGPKRPKPMTPKKPKSVGINSSKSYK